jgi:ribose 1,5-bisphosphate isomerase
MHNALNYVLTLNFDQEPEEIKQQLHKRIEFIEQFIEESKKTIVEFGVQKIQNGMVIATHCHSSTVVDILIAAKKQGKTFKVLNTETRPRFQGRITARELVKAGIDVEHHVDAAIGVMLRKSDMFLMGADAISTEGSVYNKIGSGAFSYLASSFDCPVYICTHSWKLDPLTIQGSNIVIEERDSKEVWEKPPRKLKIANPAFERIDPDHILAIISELGIYAPEQLVPEVKHRYPDLFKY